MRFVFPLNELREHLLPYSAEIPMPDETFFYIVANTLQYCVDYKRFDNTFILDKAQITCFEHLYETYIEDLMPVGSDPDTSSLAESWCEQIANSVTSVVQYVIPVITGVLYSRDQEGNIPMETILGSSSYIEFTESYTNSIIFDIQRV